MKREALCATCGLAACQLFQLPPEGGEHRPYPGEGVRAVRGITHRVFFCDGCACALRLVSRGEIAYCMTYWLGDDYRPWEAAFLEGRDGTDSTAA